MKNIAIAAVIAAGTATSASAFELGATGLSLNTEVVGEYNVDAENMLMTVEPTLGYTFASIDFTAGALMPIYNDEIVVGDELPTLDFRAGKVIATGLEVYGEVGYDLEAEERTDVVLGVSFNF